MTWPSYEHDSVVAVTERATPGGDIMHHANQWWLISMSSNWDHSKAMLWETLREKSGLGVWDDIQTTTWAELSCWGHWGHAALRKYMQNDRMQAKLHCVPLTLSPFSSHLPQWYMHTTIIQFCVFSSIFKYFLNYFKLSRSSTHPLVSDWPSGNVDEKLQELQSNEM